MLVSISGLDNPSADRILFYDFSAKEWLGMSTGTGLTISGTTLSIDTATVPLLSSANTFTARQNVIFASTALASWKNSSSSVDGAGQSLLMSIGSNSTTGVILAHYSLTGGVDTARNFIRMYDSGVSIEDSTVTKVFDANLVTKTFGFGASAGSEQFYGRVYIGGSMLTGSTNNVRGLLVNITASLGTGFAMALYDASGSTTGSNNNDHLVAYQARGIHGSTGTLSDLSGFSSIMVNNGGNVTNAYGLKVFDVTGTGTVTNNYGVYIDSLTKGTNDYAIYTAGTTQSYFGGKIDSEADTIRLRTAKTPASATAAGNAGDICWDANYLYICVATNTWRRVAHATW